MSQLDQEQQEELDWREAIAEGLDLDADDELLEVTPPDVVAVLGFDPVEFDQATRPKAEKCAKSRKAADPFSCRGQSPSVDRVLAAYYHLSPARDIERFWNAPRSLGCPSTITVLEDDGSVIRYHRAANGGAVVVERFAGTDKSKKPGAGQKSLDWNEEDHPRDEEGKFTERHGGQEQRRTAAEGSGSPPKPSKPPPPTARPLVAVHHQADVLGAGILTDEGEVGGDREIARSLSAERWTVDQPDYTDDSMLRSSYELHRVRLSQRYADEDTGEHKTRRKEEWWLFTDDPRGGPAIRKGDPTANLYSTYPSREEAVRELERLFRDAESDALWTASDDDSTKPGAEFRGMLAEKFARAFAGAGWPTLRD